jgi:XRE family transcriptional regulator, fatty acid utilization regulator
MARVPLGPKIRTRRKEQGLTQAALASEIGISASYMNLIEQDKRQIGGALLNRIAQKLVYPIEELSGEAERHVVEDLEELIADPLLRPLMMDAQSAADLAAKNPTWARAMVTVYRAYLDNTRSVMALTDRMSQDPFLAESIHAMLTHVTAIRSTSEILDQEKTLSTEQAARFHSILSSESEKLSEVSTTLNTWFDASNIGTRSETPAEEVEDLFSARNNYFAELETAATSLGKKITRGERLREGDMSEFARDKLGVLIVYEAELPAEVTRLGKLSAWNPATKTLTLLSTAIPANRRFLVARLIVELSLGELIGKILENEVTLSTAASRERAAHALSAYAASAMLLPYDDFLETARKVRFDIDALCQQYSVSYEQVCQRLVAMRRPGHEGVPFALMQSDPSGSTTKRFPLPQLPLPRHGSACPLWAIYSAFQTPGRTVRQIVRFPDQSRFIFVARSIGKLSVTFHEPEFMHSILLAYDVLYADDVVYSDGLDLGHADNVTEVGPNCRLCPREDCQFRQEDPILQRLPD